jgi:hypothetical protein
LATGAAFFAGAVFFVDAGPRFAADVDGDAFREAVAVVAFFVGAVALFVVVAAFFTDTAFFWAERFWAATDLDEDLFPATDFLPGAGRDPGALFAGVPLLAGVIVSSLTT